MRNFRSKFVKGLQNAPSIGGGDTALAPPLGELSAKLTEGVPCRGWETQLIRLPCTEGNQALCLEALHKVPLQVNSDILQKKDSPPEDEESLKSSDIEL